MQVMTFYISMFVWNGNETSRTNLRMTIHHAMFADIYTMLKTKLVRYLTLWAFAQSHFIPMETRKFNTKNLCLVELCTKSFSFTKVIYTSANCHHHAIGEMSTFDQSYTWRRRPNWVKLVVGGVVAESCTICPSLLCFGRQKLIIALKVYQKLPENNKICVWGGNIWCNPSQSPSVKVGVKRLESGATVTHFGPMISCCLQLVITVVLSSHTHEKSKCNQLRWLNWKLNPSKLATKATTNGNAFQPVSPSRFECTWNHSHTEWTMPNICFSLPGHRCARYSRGSVQN